MIIPTFHAFGPKADTANAFLGGQRLQVQRESIAAEAAQAAARIQLGRETLQQRAVEAELEAKTRQEIAARQALKSAQDAEIEKSYNLTKFGLEERRLEAAEAATVARLQQADRNFGLAERRATNAEDMTDLRYQQEDRQALQQTQNAESLKTYRDAQLGQRERKLKTEEDLSAMRLKEGAYVFDQRQNYERVLPEMIEKYGPVEGPKRAWAQTGAGQPGFTRALSGAEAKPPPLSPAVKSSVKLLEDSIGENRRELLRTSKEGKRLDLQNSIADDTFKLHRLLSPPTNAPPVMPQQPLVPPMNSPSKTNRVGRFNVISDL